MSERLDFKSYNPTILVIFGATGDLARRKLLPALFRLYRKKLLPPLFQVIGFSRQNLSDAEFQSMVKETLGKEKSGSLEAIESFRKMFIYSQGFFEKKSGYKKLAEQLGYRDNEWRTCSNKLFYLAVPPTYYKKILHNLADSGLTIPCSPEEGWTRVLVEKPFGRDLKTAESLDKLLGTLFREEQIYRIDHYLAKDTVQNILAFRFSNYFLEPAWDKNSIEKISFRFFEAAGLEGRGSFYDGVGALRDVGQNHLLQLLALFTMENPLSFDADSIRRQRAEVLRILRIFKKEEIKQFTSRAQYHGYREEKNVKPGSMTETYFRITAFLDTPRFEDVPLELESGKYLPESKVEVVVAFKHPSPCLCPPRKHYRNVLRYNIQPKEGITTSFWVKRPGPEMALEEKDFSFDYKSAFSEELFVDAYERLLLDAFSGNQTLFVSTDEITASWKFIDPILRAWKKNLVPLQFYKPGSFPVIEEVKRESGSVKKELGLIGLGKMGRNMGLRLLEKGWRVIAYDRDEKARKKFVEGGGLAAEDVKEFKNLLAAPRLVWLMVPSAKVDEVIDELLAVLEKGDVVIDGGNSFFEDSIKRAKKLKKADLEFLDVGVSGGPAGARYGASIMVGGQKSVYEKYEHLFRELAVSGGYGYVGKSGAGHFVKMVHNGIEYGMMQSLAEGFAVLNKSKYGFDLRKIAAIYDNGSVIQSRLVDWLKKAFSEYGQELKEISGSVAHTGEGEWTVKTAKKLGVPVKIIKDSFKFRVASAKKPSYIGKILSALRNQFGGHSVKN